MEFSVTGSNGVRGLGLDWRGEGTAQWQMTHAVGLSTGHLNDCVNWGHPVHSINRKNILKMVNFDMILELAARICLREHIHSH